MNEALLHSLPSGSRAGGPRAERVRMHRQNNSPCGARPVVGKLISQQSQISTVLLQNRLAQAENRLLRMGHEVSIALYARPHMVFCGRATLKGPKSRMWLASHSLPTTGLGDLENSNEKIPHGRNRFGSVDRASA
uniref:Uncharacterized protein n=1 Tax=Myotis myotis TaxID=51298 RepID=A0A7J7UCY3_MYOMY|nr:hypothetical protein mMyoMyo1_008740 [Myotis myotis]